MKGRLKWNEEKRRRPVNPRKLYQIGYVMVDYMRPEGFEKLNWVSKMGVNPDRVEVVIS